MRSLAKLSFRDALKEFEKSCSELGYSHRLESSPHPHSSSDYSLSLSFSLRTITWSRELKRAQAVTMETSWSRGKGGTAEGASGLEFSRLWYIGGRLAGEGGLGGAREGTRNLGNG